MQIKTIGIITLLIFIGACSGESFQLATNNGSKVIENEDLTAGLKGIDADGNGIRDDVDRLIANKYSATPQIKSAAEQTAKALQKALESTTKEHARYVGNELMRASDCAFKAIDDEDTRLQLSRELEAITANTKERFSAYWHGEKLSGGMVFQSPKVLICD